MSKNLTVVMALAALFAASAQPRAQEAPPACNPKLGNANARIECLTKMVISLNEKLAELPGKLDKSAKSADSSAYLTRSEFDSVLADYVKYKSPVAINLATEPSNKPARRPVARQGQGQEETKRFGTLGGQVGEIDGQSLGGDFSGRVIAEEMDAGDQGVGGQHQLFSRRRRQQGGVVAQAQAPRPGKGSEITGDQFRFIHDGPDSRLSLRPKTQLPGPSSPARRARR